jgi:hypothetical protein
MFVFRSSAGSLRDGTVALEYLRNCIPDAEEGSLGGRVAENCSRKQGSATQRRLHAPTGRIRSRVVPQEEPAAPAQHAAPHHDSNQRSIICVSLALFSFFLHRLALKVFNFFTFQIFFYSCVAD